MIIPVTIDGQQMLAVTLNYKCIEDVRLVRESLITVTKAALLNELGLKSGVCNGGEIIDVLDIIESMEQEATSQKGGQS